MSNLNSAAKEFVPATFHPAPPVPQVPYEYDMNGYSYLPQQIPPSYPLQFSQPMAYGQRPAFVSDHPYNNQYIHTQKDNYNSGNYRMHNGGARGPRMPNRNNYPPQMAYNNRESNIMPVKLENSTLSTASPEFVPSSAAIAAAIAISQTGTGTMVNNDPPDCAQLVNNDANSTTATTSIDTISATSNVSTTAAANTTTTTTAAITSAVTSSTPSVATSAATAEIADTSNTSTHSTTVAAVATTIAVTVTNNPEDTTSATVTLTTSTAATATANNSAAATTASATTSAAATTNSTSNSQGWRRSTPEISVIPRSTVSEKSSPAAAPLNSSLWSRAKSNTIRYDKATIMSLFVRDQEIPPELKLVFVEKHLRERIPIDPNISLPSPPTSNNINKDETSEVANTEESPVTVKKDVFRFDPSRFGDPNSDNAKLLKSRSVLNKLTPEKYDKLTKEYMEIGLDTTNELLQSAVNLIVKKAQMEEHFSFMYGNLCKTLCTSWTRSVPPPTGTTTTLGEEFRLALLKSCEAEFNIENRRRAYDEIAQMDISEDVKREKYALLRRCYTGHMRFVGEIYKQDIVKASIMRDCLDELLDTIEEDKLLCLCKLFAVIGAKLEAYEKQKKKGSKIKEYFETIQHLIDSGEVSQLVRYSLMELVDLRRNNWVVRREELKAQTIAEIRGEVNPSRVTAAATASASAASTSSSTKSTQDESKSTKTKEATDDEWHTVSSGKKKSASTTTTSSNSMNTNTTTQRQVPNGKSSHDTKDKDKPKKATKETPVSRNTNNVASTSIGGMFGVLGGGGGSGKEKKEKKKDKEKDKKEKSSKKGNASSGNTNGQSSKRKEEEEEEDDAGVENEDNKGEESAAAVVEEEEEEEEDTTPHVEKEVLMKKIKSSVNDLTSETDKQFICEELVGEIKALIPASQRRDFFKYLLEYISEDNISCYDLLLMLLQRLYETGVLPLKEMQKGFLSFLEVYADFVCDAPLAITHVPAVIGRLLLTIPLDLSAFSLLSWEPPKDKEYWLDFAKYLELFVSILGVIQKLSDLDGAKKAYVGSKLSITSILEMRVMDDNTDPEVKAAVEKYSAYVTTYEG